MNKQRKVLITITYNEMGIIIDTKTEELGSSAQPERKTERNTGKWILKDHMFECDKCGCRINRYPFKGNIWNYYYCPNCGAYMGGEQDD